jgi:hypothetical protein
MINGSAAMPVPTIQIERANKSKEEVDNLACINWVSWDQQVLSYLLPSMNKKILVQVTSPKHAFEVWTAVTEVFSSHAKS